MKAGNNEVPADMTESNFSSKYHHFGLNIRFMSVKEVIAKGEMS